MPCAACERPNSRKDWIVVHPRRQGELVRICSDACLETFWLALQPTHDKGQAPMVDPDEREEQAIEHASDQAGEYLDSLGRTDLATLSREEWLTLLQVTVTAFQDKMREVGDDDCPF